METYIVNLSCNSVDVYIDANNEEDAVSKINEHLKKYKDIDFKYYNVEVTGTL